MKAKSTYYYYQAGTVSHYVFIIVSSGREIAYLSRMSIQDFADSLALKYPMICYDSGFCSMCDNYAYCQFLIDEEGCV